MKHVSTLWPAAVPAAAVLIVALPDVAAALLAGVVLLLILAGVVGSLVRPLQEER
jgi:hypothetical protein